MTVTPELDRRFREAAAAEGLLDVGFDVVDSPIGPLLVAATGRGMFTFRTDDLLRVRDRDAAHGYRYVLPARWQYRAHKDDTVDGLEGFRYSFVSLDRTTEPPALLAGEYTNDPTRTR